MTGVLLAPLWGGLLCDLYCTVLWHRDQGFGFIQRSILFFLLRVAPYRTHAHLVCLLYMCHLQPSLSKISSRSATIMYRTTDPSQNRRFETAQLTRATRRTRLWRATSNDLALPGPRHLVSPPSAPARPVDCATGQRTDPRTDGPTAPRWTSDESGPAIPRK